MFTAATSALRGSVPLVMLPIPEATNPMLLRRGWKKCLCPIYACGTLAGTFKRKNTERFL
jgi:hypothetical protein